MVVKVTTFTCMFIFPSNAARASPLGPAPTMSTVVSSIMVLEKSSYSTPEYNRFMGIVRACLDDQVSTRGRPGQRFLFQGKQSLSPAEM